LFIDEVFDAIDRDGRWAASETSRSTVGPDLPRPLTLLPAELGELMARLDTPLMAAEQEAALAALDAGPWGAAAAPLAAEAATSARRRELDVIGAAYLEIRLAKVAAALAQSDQVALEACRARDWIYRAKEATLVPRPPAPAAPAFENFEQLAQLTQLATHLTA